MKVDIAMSEKLKKFLEAVSMREDLVTKIKDLDKEQLLALATELSVELAEADLVETAEELDDTELDNVSGGNSCTWNGRVTCVVTGGGSSSDELRPTCLQSGKSELNLPGL